MRNSAQSPRNWQEVIRNLLNFSEMEKRNPPNYANQFLQIANQLQALIDNDGSEQEKEAFFAEIAPIYSCYEQTSQAVKNAIAVDAERKRQEQINKEKREAELAEWKALPFYAQDNFSNVICIENRESLDDKLFAISCMLDNLKAVPALLEINTQEADSDQLNGRIAEMAKLYISFANEQFNTLHKQVLDQLGGE
ncbi:hypothetical protein NYR68_02780 [Actinobacillus equuli subsp. haemolyticus]|uniref:hypothetical protein n=1 Tax=Actinobacillus equuli TaxID=718 RepID=UPI0024466062|nr:hypothetical protein [Actinobacillus equuli]WGE51332.1 hypothetical protein NYR68_02780 [Actinobacillus equuli subsp. haemolyticus]